MPGRPCSMVRKRAEIIFGKLQVVDDFPADRKPGEPGNRERPDHLIAKIQPPWGLRRKGASKAFGAPLFDLEEGPQARFIAVEGLPISAVRRGKLPAST